MLILHPMNIYDPIMNKFTCVILPIVLRNGDTQIMSYQLWNDHGYDHVLQCIDMHMMFDNIPI